MANADTGGESAPQQQEQDNKQQQHSIDKLQAVKPSRRVQKMERRG
jgi:hypothetical protein